MVANLQEFKAKKEAEEKPLISRRDATLTAGSLLTALCNIERNDLLATLRFDTTPEDLITIQSFIFHLQHRTAERLARSKTLK